MIIGNFTYDAMRNTYHGDIQTLTFAREGVSLRPAQKTGERGPDYRVFAETEGGTVELGAAWRRQSEKGHSFLSVMLDDPAFGQPVNVALFDDREGSATMVWTRPRQKTAEPVAAAEAAAPSLAPKAEAPAPFKKLKAPGRIAKLG